MGLKGKLIEAEQAKSKAELEKVTGEKESLESELTTVKKDLKEFGKLSSSNEELAAKLKEKEEALDKSEKERENAARQFKFDTALSAKAKELKLRNPDDLRRFLDLDKVKLKDDNTFEGLDDQITKLQQNNSYLFEGTQKQQYNPAGGATPPKEVTTLKDALTEYYSGERD